MVATSSPTGAGVTTKDPSPFHVGEKQVQSLTGARELSEQLGRAWHSKHLTPATADFFSRQQLLYTASRNQDGRLWASVLAGPTAFVSARDPSSVTVQPFQQFKGDPAEFSVGDHIGTLGIILETRQRERLNGIVQAKEDGSLTITVQQSFSGCPKYIQARKVEVVEDRLSSLGSCGEVTTGDTVLGTAERDLIARSDTLFLATCYYGPLDAGDGVNGCDNSHRGGPPGFVQVTGPGTLRWADYVGNYTFTTLGNLLVDPRASIQFLDFATGNSLQLSGTCRILWDQKALPGAERTMEFETEKWVHVRGALPLRTPGQIAWSPYNPLPTAQYNAAVGEDRLKQLANNYCQPEPLYTMLRCLSVTQEAQDVKTFEFEGVGKRTGSFTVDPGQFASFDFPDIVPGKTINRSWTVSSPQSQIQATSTFTITIKKVGLVSGWMFENMKVGRTICFRGLDGDFTLGRLSQGPQPPAGVLLIAGGIGITPLRTIFHKCIGDGIPVTLLYSVRNLEDAVFYEELEEIAAGKDSAKVYLTATQQVCNDGDEMPYNETGKTAPLHGRVNAAMIQQICSDVLDRAVFQCGPVALMTAVSAELAGLGFTLKHLHQEAFNF